MSDTYSEVINAMRAAWRNGTENKLLRDIVRALPRATQEVFWSHMLERLRNNDEQLKMLVLYWLDGKAREPVEKREDSKLVVVTPSNAAEVAKARRKARARQKQLAQIDAWFESQLSD
jgi:hypothetical protein